MWCHPSVCCAATPKHFHHFLIAANDGSAVAVIDKCHYLYSHSQSTRTNTICQSCSSTRYHFSRSCYEAWSTSVAIGCKMEHCAALSLGGLNVPNHKALLANKLIDAGINLTKQMD